MLATTKVSRSTRWSTVFCLLLNLISMVRVLDSSNNLDNHHRAQLPSSRQDQRGHNGQFYFPSTNQIKSEGPLARLGFADRSPRHKTEPFGWPALTAVPGSLTEPANVPVPFVGQEEADYLQKYMTNYFSLMNSQGLANGTLNLGSINDRRPVAKTSERLVANQETNPLLLRPSGANGIQQQQAARAEIRRDDRVQQVELIGGNFEPIRQAKVGHIEDVLGFGKADEPQRQPPRYINHATKSSAGPSYTQTANSRALVNRPLLPLVSKQNCILAATSFAAECEDHLIRKLNQDAAEGRTVIDVGRRVCCALFAHNDCISRVVLKSCPDSSPTAADYLLGSRKLDLTLSCQRFNRDGCNAANSLQPTHALAMILLCSCAIMFQLSVRSRGH